MTQALRQRISFDEFIQWLPESSECRYELHRGLISEMPKPKGKHSEVAGFAAAEVSFAIRQQQLPYFIGYPKRPTFSIYSLTEEGEYKVQQFRRNECIFSPTFSYLVLTAEQVFAAGQ